MGLDAALDRFWEAADGRRLGIDAIEVVTDDGPGGERRRIDDICRDVYSVSKTVTSLAVGMLAGDGALSLDDPVLTHLPGLAGTAAAGSEKITIGHLLRMTAGNGYRWADADADHPGDPARDFLAAPLVAEPGTAYHYRGGCTYVLGRVVHAISGLDLRDFLVPRLFDPLGIRNPQWLRCPLGFPLAAAGLQLRTREITRIAQLLLHDSTCDRGRLVPGDDIARMTTDTTATGRAEPDNQTYGLHVWLCARDRAWRMDGIYGQFGIVLPEQHTCVSVTGHYQGPTTRILDCVWGTHRARSGIGACNITQLRDDLEWLIFLLGGSDRQDPFGQHRHASRQHRNCPIPPQIATKLRDYLARHP